MFVVRVSASAQAATTSTSVVDVKALCGSTSIFLLIPHFAKTIPETDIFFNQLKKIVCSPQKR
jgi:hypothetical protein